MSVATTPAGPPPARARARRPSPRRRRFRVALAVAVLATLAAGTSVVLHRSRSAIAAGCTATGPDGVFVLGLDQAANAGTIAAVARRDGLPDHAVTVALAAALQESKLRNLDSGDLDSVGLFQQRPSQGWGPAQDLLVPRLAAEAFFRALVKISGWASLPVTDAAQRVQRSAAPDAYAQWEAEARTLALGLTGESPGTLGCRFAVPRRSTAVEPLAAALQAENGDRALEAVGPRGWTVAGWLVSHAASYRITRVAFGTWVWTARVGRWAPAAGPSGAGITVARAGVPPGQELAVP